MTALLTTLLLGACTERAQQEPWQQQLAAWKHPDPVPPFELVDQRGRAFSLARHRDEHVLVGCDRWRQR